MDLIIAGCGRGIGFETAKIFAQLKDIRVLALSRNITQLELLKESIKEQYKGSEFIPFSIDFDQIAFTNQIIKVVEQQRFKPSILIYNAGLLINKPIREFTESDFDRQFHVNVKAGFLLIQTLLPYFAENAHIVTISSMGGYQGSSKFPGLSLYSAAKGALAVMSECFAEELKDSKISVNSLALGAAQTEMLEMAFPGIKAPLSAAQMAEFIADFAMNGSKYFNGKILPVSISTP
ncbi:MAG: SDR family oxidoreductase [Bacteroidales bacterium]|jgi:NAD(P)-dependent dehydrogenase (short-subunit alcohol dehydrogenase family)|nr:SDR family oxidoreductase [Bacteroidales bacterium]